jgi:two-component system, NarL family, sensor histidine kinase DesK
VVILIVFTVQNLNNVVIRVGDRWLVPQATLGAIAIVALQLHHSRPRQAGVRPRWWPATLALQAVLSYALLPFVGALSLIYLGFLAGSAVLLVRGRWGWTAFVAVLASCAVISVSVPFSPGSQVSIRGAIYVTALFSAIGLVVYGLSRLTALAGELEAVRDELTRSAVLRERLRVARNVHDLLGLGLSAIALKADLVLRLVTGGDPRARAEMEEMRQICLTARNDIRLVADDASRLSLGAEVARARQVLFSAGIDLETRAPERPVPDNVDALLATVLREAVTNVLRHSTARECRIEVVVDGDVLRLFVGNDGAPAPRAPGGRAGSGLANLTARVQAAGGRFTSRRDGERFDLVAEVPLPAPPS